MVNELDIKTLSLEEAYELFISEVDKYRDSKIYGQIRFGIKIRFDIYDYLNGNIRVKHKSGKAIIKGRVYDMEDIYGEIEERNKEMKEWLVENIVEETFAKARGLDKKKPEVRT